MMPAARRTSASDLTPRRRVLLVTNRYRTYHRRVLETLMDAFDFGIIWLSPPYEHDPVPPELAVRLRSWTLGDDPRRLTYRDPRRSAALFRLVLREARGADLLIAPTASAWKGKVLFAAAKLAGVPIAFRSEVWREGDGLVRATPARPRTGVRAFVGRALNELVERGGDALLVPGTKSRDYLVERGVEIERIVRFPRLHPEISRLPQDRELVARLTALKGSRVAFLYLGRVMHQKGLVPLVRAFRQLLASGRDAVLFVVGGPIVKDVGAGRSSVEYFAEAKALAGDEPRIIFFGNVDPTLVHNYYAAADVFVHPHVANVDGQDVFEPWGNVISEAACMGMAIVASDRVPAAFDFIEPGRNGYLLDATRLDDELEHTLAAIVDAPAQRRAELGRVSREKYDAFADPARLVDAIDAIIDRARR